MAHAFRSRKSGREAPGTNGLCVSGTYNIEEKVTVEWERVVAIGEMVALIQRLPNRLYSRRELRSFISGHFRDSDDSLPHTKISKYRISGGSLNALLDALECEGALAQRETESGLACWAPKERR
jgi:hypothetical protein